MYLAQEVRYNVTGHYTACSEGGVGLEVFLLRINGLFWLMGVCGLSDCVPKWD